MAPGVASMAPTLKRPRYRTVLARADNGIRLYRHSTMRLHQFNRWCCLRPEGFKKFPAQYDSNVLISKYIIAYSRTRLGYLVLIGGFRPDRSVAVGALH